MEKITNLLSLDTLNALSKANLNSYPQILDTSTKEIHNRTRISLEDIKKIKKVAADEVLKNKICTVDQLPPWDRLRTGCKNIDSVLRNGLPINGIVELYGPSGVGKTQFCLQVALQTKLSCDKGAVYICTEDVFPAKRLSQLSVLWREKHNLNIDFESNVYIQHIPDSIHLNKCLKVSLPRLMETKNIGIIVIDSIAGLFRSENENPNYITRSQDFREISRNLLQLQKKYNCALLVTNQVIDNLITGISEPCLGLAWANNVVTRLSIQRTCNNVRSFQVIFSPDLPPLTTNFIIESDGLNSV
ncbi:DNA repair protein XRCC3 isoform X2 [Sitophilus oryzae]|uniref:DNA repair protein XRCC3 isoform X2 n=1 Tax=Sitophilus oryzae TaxID=7048 RepID=A0A6J2X9D1_SITOR|nr:DNA repair protein XRCC3 isoform X2 [Sitophilus oryzae]